MFVVHVSCERLAYGMGEGVSELKDWTETFEKIKKFPFEFMVQLSSLLILMDIIIYEYNTTDKKKSGNGNC